MYKGSRRCRVCKRQAAGALLQVHLNGRTMFPSVGVYGCQEHLDEAVRREAAAKLSTSTLVLALVR